VDPRLDCALRPHQPDDAAGTQAPDTDLKGAKIASTDKAAAEGKNSLTTETLTQSDIQNRSDYKAESQSVGIGTGFDGSKLAMNGTGIGVGSASGSESSTTRSGISQAEIKITDDAAQQVKTSKTAAQAIASINTDVSSDRDTSGKLNKTWNGQALQADVQAQAQITELFGKNAAKAVGDYASARVKEIESELQKASSPEEVKALLDEQSKWMEGGLYRTALHAAVGALGGGFEGALGAATASSAMPLISEALKGLDLPESVRQGVEQVIAAGLGSVVGGSSGLIAGVQVEANNRQLHKEEINWIGKKKDEAAKYLSDKLGRLVSPEEAAVYLTLAGQGNVDEAYQTANANFLGLQTSEERQLYNAAKQFISSNAVGSFTDERGVTQKLFLAVGNDFKNGIVNSEFRNDKQYRDFFWRTLGENLKPDNPTPVEQAEYEAREKLRLGGNLTQAGVGMIPAVLAAVAGRIAAAARPGPKFSQAVATPPEPEKIVGGKGSPTQESTKPASDYSGSVKNYQDIRYVGVDGKEIPGALPITERGLSTTGKVGGFDDGSSIASGTTYAQRLAQTPTSNGIWTGPRGESTFVSTHPEIAPILGSKGVPYKNAYPDFTFVAAAEVQIPEMGVSRTANFAQADLALAKQLGLSPSEIKEWRYQNKYTWHEVEDLTTMQLVPIKVNEKFGHVGGVGAINAGKIKK
jgi:hypothetical protein